MADEALPNQNRLDELPTYALNRATNRGRGSWRASWAAPPPVGEPPDQLLRRTNKQQPNKNTTRLKCKQ